jgi:DNA repair exonuclease SbcCD ATPase subunit
MGNTHDTVLIGLRATNFKGGDREIEFSGADLFLGANGTGKTSILQLLYMAVFGKPPVSALIDRTAAGLWSLTRPGAREATIELGFRRRGRVMTVSRTWSLDKDGSVAGDAQGFGKQGQRAAGNLIESTLGAFGEAWDPLAWFRQGVEKRRKSLIDIAGGALGDAKRWYPEGLPERLRTSGTVVYAPHEWVAFAIHRADDEAKEAAKEVKRIDSELSRRKIDAHWQNAEEKTDPEDIQGDLENERHKLEAAQARRRHAFDIGALEEKIRAKREALASRPTVPTVEAARAAVDALASEAQSAGKRDALIAEGSKLGARVTKMREDVAKLRQEIADATEGAAEAQVRAERLGPVVETIMALEQLSLEMDAYVTRPRQTALKRLGELAGSTRNTYEVLQEAIAKEKELHAAAVKEERGLEAAVVIADQRDQPPPEWMCGECKPRFVDWVAEAFEDVITKRASCAKALADLQAHRDTLDGLRRGAAIAGEEASLEAIAAKEQEIVAKQTVLRGKLPESIAWPGTSSAALLKLQQEEARKADRLRASATKDDGRREDMEADLAAEERRLDATKAAILDLPASEGVSAKAKKAREDLEEAQRQAKMAEDIEDLTAERDTEKASFEKRPVIDEVAVAAEINRLEKRLGEAKVTERLKREVGELEDALTSAQKLQEDMAAWVGKLKKIEGSILGTLVGGLEQRFTTAAQAPVKVQLWDTKGKEDCTILVGGVPCETLSDGELIASLAGLLYALAEGSEAEWRPLMVDRLESISMNRRESFLVSLLEAKKAGAFQNLLVAGCPDTRPSVQGWKVHAL